MKTKSILRIIIMASALLLALSLNSFAQGTSTDCFITSKNKTVVAIYKQIKKKYPDHFCHVNVTIAKGTVTLEGWATPEVLPEIEAIAKKMKGVKQVDNKLSESAGGGCGDGQKECGQTCIPIAQQCSIGRSGN